MADTLLDKLARLSEIVPETADLSVVKRYHARHVNLSTSRITAAAQDPAHASIVDDAIRWAQRDVGLGGNRKLVATRAVERLAVEFAHAMAEMVTGHVSVAVDGRLAHQRRATIDKARELVARLEELGIRKDRILVKIPATWDGIEAAAKLRGASEIGCHLTLVFGAHQLGACADAGALIVSPAVGRITDWHRKQDGVEEYPPEADPGVKAVLGMHQYLRGHGYGTLVMPEAFRSVAQVLALAGCELLTLPPTLLEELDEARGELRVAIDRDAPAGPVPAKVAVDSASFATLHAADPIAKSKLESGVRNLSWAVVSQQQQLAEWICKRQDEAAESSTAALFRIWDYDGDGYIDREEWNGTEEVFNALDRDGNGRISLEEMAVGLGAPYRPPDQ